MRSRAWVSWSSGKVSAYAFCEARRRGDLEIVGLVTTVTTAFARVSMHGVRESLLDRQVAETGLPCRKIGIPSPCPNEIYEAEMARALLEAKADGVTHMIFGDLFLQDIRAYREAKLAPIGMTPVFPLWHRDTASFAGRRFDAGFLAELPAGVDPCGENGEFHTFVSAGPMFAKPIPVATGEV